MIEELLQKNLEFKYNNWCERRGLVCSDNALYFRAVSFSNKKDLSPSEKAAFYFHELTGCDGMEFVAFSNVRIEKPIILPNKVIIVPCFLSENKREGLDIRDPFLKATMEMERRHRYVYDGWIPITLWDKENVRKAVRSIDEAFSIFCLPLSIFFKWIPKYSSHSKSELPIFPFGDQEILELESLSKHLDSLKEKDRIALYRSIAWLSQSLRLEEPAAQFLFLILSIESLARYIEDESTTESPFYNLKSRRLIKSERREERENCIDTILSKMLDSDKTKAVKTAYFDCVVGIKKQLETHLRLVFGSTTEPIEVLFEEKVEGFSLYDLRHIIAHGDIDALSEAQRDLIQKRVWDAEKIARKYILIVLNKSLNFQLSKGVIQSEVSLDLKDMVMSCEGMNHGPTHMAIIYS